MRSVSRSRGLAAILSVFVIALAGCGGGSADTKAANASDAAGADSSAASSEEPDPRLEIPEPTLPPVPTSYSPKQRDRFLQYVSDIYVWGINSGFSTKLLKVFPGGEDTPTAELISDIDRIREDGLLVESSPLVISNLTCDGLQKRQGMDTWVCRWEWTAEHVVVTTADGETQQHDNVRSQIAALIRIDPGRGIGVWDWRATGDLPSAVIP